MYVVLKPRWSQPVVTLYPPAAAEACGENSCDVEVGRGGDCSVKSANAFYSMLNADNKGGSLTLAALLGGRTLPELVTVHPAGKPG